jgi:hypothetical protein
MEYHSFSCMEEKNESKFIETESIENYKRGERYDQTIQIGRGSLQSFLGLYLTKWTLDPSYFISPQSPLVPLAKHNLGGASHFVPAILVFEQAVTLTSSHYKPSVLSTSGSNPNMETDKTRLISQQIVVTELRCLCCSKLHHGDLPWNDPANHLILDFRTNKLFLCSSRRGLVLISH